MTTQLDKPTFYSYVRNAPFNGRISTAQLAGMEAILDYWLSSASYNDIRWLAYILATAYHETAGTMQPVRETLATSDAQAIARLDGAYKAGKLRQVSTPYWRDGYFGRGFVQLTHRTNYVRMGAILKLPLADKPSLALDMKIAVAILFEGMTRGASKRGDFSGKSLEDFFNDTKDDPIGARSIINGKDKADLIASYYLQFYGAIKKAVEVGKGVKPVPPTVAPEDAKPDDVPAAQSGTAWLTTAAPLLSGVALPAVTGINNGYALAFSLVLVAVGCLAAYMFFSGRFQINRSKAL